MRAKQYATLRALGRCTYTTTCMEPLAGSTICSKHKAKHKRYLKTKNQSLRERYLANKIAGLCVATACNEPASETNARCPRHATAHNARSKKYQATPQHKEMRKRAYRRQIEARRRAGKCRRCKLPPVTRDLCREHQREHNAYKEALRRSMGIPPSTQKCSNCQGVGHRYSTCANYTVTELPETALGRRYIAAEAAELERKRQMARERNRKLNDTETEADEPTERTPRRPWNVGVRDLDV